MRAGKRKKLDKANSPIDALMDKIEKCKASIRAKVEHLFSLNQAPVWLREGALPGLEETHPAAQNAVCSVKPVDDAPPVAGRTGMSASESKAIA